MPQPTTTIIVATSAAGPEASCSPGSYNRTVAVMPETVEARFREVSRQIPRRIAESGLRPYCVADGEPEIAMVCSKKYLLSAVTKKK